MVKKVGEFHGAAYLEAIRNNDRKMLKVLYKELFPGIALFVQRNSGRRSDAHDVFQEALIVLFRKAKDPKFTIRQSFKSYLFVVCKQIWFNELRKSNRKQVGLEEAPALVEEDGIESIICDRERDTLFRNKFAQLGKDCRKLLQLFFDGTSMVKIAGAMKYGSESYAKKRKFQCKQKLIHAIQADPIFAELTTR